MNGRFVVIGCLLAIWPVLRMLPQLSAAEAVSLDATREIRIAGAAEAGNSPLKEWRRGHAGAVVMARMRKPQSSSPPGVPTARRTIARASAV